MNIPRPNTAVRLQVAAMGCERFRIGVFRPETSGTDASMLLRVWDWDNRAACGALVAPAESC